MNGGFLLDTNVLSELSRPRVEPKVKQWVASRNFGTLFISVIYQRRNPRRDGEGFHNDERLAKASPAEGVAGT